MKPIKSLIDFAITFAIVFIVTIIVSYIYSLIAHDAGLIDWGVSFRFGIIFGIAFTVIKIFERRNKDK